MPSADETPSAFTDALEIFYAPSEVFERRKVEPAFGLPLIILALAIGILFFASRSAMDPIFDAEFKRGFAAAMKQNPQLTSEMEAQAQETSRKFVPVFVIGYSFFAPFFIGFFLWLAGKLVGAKQELAAACMVATFALYPRDPGRDRQRAPGPAPARGIAGRQVQRHPRARSLLESRYGQPPSAGADWPYRCIHYLGDCPSRHWPVHHRQDPPVPGRAGRGTRVVGRSPAPRIGRHPRDGLNHRQEYP